MRLKEQQKSDLNKIVSAVSRIQNVLGIILFGSQAKGDYDEFSDYDFLILFENRPLMWETWDELFQVVGSLNMNLHAIPETLEELKNANPVFLEDLCKYGRVLFAKIPLEVFLQPLNLESFSLITYDMRKASYAEKMKASYFLYSKGGGGAVAKAGGTKISDGCIIVLRDMADKIVAFLSSLGMHTREIQIFINPSIFKSYPNRNVQSLRIGVGKSIERQERTKNLEN
jgi:predicted nucleotidyltransferase